MDEIKLVSVIIPVYNVESYVERCVKSIIAQSYTNIEIILVDDGSTDHSGDICDRLHKDDKRIIVIHQDNKGLAGARNTGIDKARGEYICFVDSDDYVHPDYVKYLLGICIDNDCEIGICGYYSTEGIETFHEVDWNKKAAVYSKKQIFDSFYSDMHVPIVVAWNKIYKKSCIGDIRYSEGIIHEDEATTFIYLYNARKIAYSQEVLYYYFNRDDSITGQNYSERNLDILYAYKKRMDFYKEHGETEFFERECQFYLSEILSHYYKVYRYLGKDKRILSDLKKRYRSAYILSDRKNWDAKRRSLYLLCFYFPLLYGRLRKAYISN